VTETELAWAAGIIDGEGCFHGREVKGKRHAYYWAITFSITQKYPEILYRFQAALGVGVVNGPYTYDGYTHYSYRVTGYKKVRALAKAVWPYMSIHKKRQANEVFRKYKAGPTRGSTARAQGA